MYIFKNAFRNVFRNKGRTILTGIIIIAIAFSSCVALSIRQAAQTAREDVLSGLSITAQISMDRSKMMKDIVAQRQSSDTDSSSDSSSDSDSKMDFAKLMGEGGLSVEDMQTYAAADSVQSFYYTLTSSVNAEEIEAVESSSSVKNKQTDSDTASDSESDEAESGKSGGMSVPGMGAMPGGMEGPSMGTQGSFTLIGYSSDEAMTDFVAGTSKITSGQVFEENTDALECIISEELAEYNSLAVGDTITVTNPNDESETYTLTVVGIYSNTQSGVQSMGNMGFSTASDPANQILMSYTALKSITDSSAANATTTTNDFGLEQSSALSTNVSGTYVFETVEDYESFEAQARELGLSEDYTVSSSDLERYEQSLQPLETLSKIAGYFLIVILAIGGIIIVVLNVLSARERKYEIGVLTAVGMKKKKVAAQFISEILIVTLMAAVIGGAAGAVSAVPVTNALLESQITASEEASSSTKENFGRPSDFGTPPDMNGAPGMDNDSQSTQESSDSNAADSGRQFGKAQYVSSVSKAVNLKVLAELLGISVLLAAAGAAVAVSAIMRYEPLKILSNRD